MEVGTWRGSNGLLYRWRLNAPSVYGPRYELEYSAEHQTRWHTAGCAVLEDDAVAAGSALIALHCYREESSKRRLEALGEAALEAAERAQERTQDAIASQGAAVAENGYRGFHAVAPFERDDNGLQPGEE